MKKNKIIFGAIIVLCIIGIFFYFNQKDEFIEPGDYDDFAICLTESGAIIYGTEWCSFCQRQKDLFANSFPYINYVDCDKNPQECSIAQVRGFPTWNINGTNYPGLLSLQRLSEITGCKIN